MKYVVVEIRGESDYESWGIEGVIGPFDSDNEAWEYVRKHKDKDLEVRSLTQSEEI